MGCLSGIIICKRMLLQKNPKKKLNILLFTFISFIKRMSLFSSSTFSRIRKGSTFSSSLWSKGNYVTHRQNQFIKIPLSTISTDSFYLNNLSSNATLKTELNQLRDNKGSTKNVYQLINLLFIKILTFYYLD